MEKVISRYMVHIFYNNNNHKFNPYYCLGLYSKSRKKKRTPQSLDQAATGLCESPKMRVGCASVLKTYLSKSMP